MLDNIDKKNNKDNKIQIKELQTVPKVIKKFYPKITNDEYDSIKENILFKNTKIPVCSYCYMILIEKDYEVSGGKAKIVL